MAKVGVLTVGIAVISREEYEELLISRNKINKRMFYWRHADPLQYQKGRAAIRAACLLINEFRRNNPNNF